MPKMLSNTSADNKLKQKMLNHARGPPTLTWAPAATPLARP
eukprot:CAMPEP_0204376068 /NCGR_PEP_ID=MMETSP0469-20131031/49757_1 /ASSEMBLY_ACC=CAM_ASM_000384 /TAXON_ID=2969 /ORGANISM="Oxyrrhis marina" /LENGTH=40 /DNA_ID= /DNA_START= /DNA_END= /DNA_ORIENTATION=